MDHVITSATAFAVLRHAPAVQPAPRDGRPQARGGLRVSRVANCPAAAVVEGLQARQQIHIEDACTGTNKES